MTKYNKSIILELFVISLISLYFELLIIRWLSSEIRIFAYFKNVPLMACLFGLGLGMAVANSKQNLMRWFPVALLVIVTIICLAAPLHLVHMTFLNPLDHYLVGNFLTNIEQDSIWNKLRMFLPGLTMLVSVFYLIVFTFMTLGQRIGQLFTSFPPLVAYCINVAASLIGILLFSTISFLSLSPPIWLLIGILLCIYFFRKPYQLGAFTCALVLAFMLTEKQVLWSPYYRISLVKNVIPRDGKYPSFDYGHDINVNYDTIEGAYNNNPKPISQLSERQLKGTIDYYNTPYLVLGAKPRSVLILAAGTGNDVAAALRYGATDVDAVEIDPTIAKIGQQLHPEKPYSDPRVHLIVNDARAYLRTTKKRYDLIVFGYLDSHSAFSSMSSLRLDNYVYTKESFEDAHRLLKPDGAMSVTFHCFRWWQLARVYQALKLATHEEPAGLFSPLGYGPTFLVGKGLDRTRLKNCGLRELLIDTLSREVKFSRTEWDQINPTTDDWPFLFLRDRHLSWTYAIGIIFTLFLGYRLVGLCFGNYTTERYGRIMFFLGAAFMLIETKSVTQMGLLMGTTWLVNSAVITAVLILILLANCLQLKFKFKKTDVLFVLLFLCLIMNYLMPLSVFNGLDIVSRSIIGSIFLCIPLFFAAMIFAITFAQVERPDKALGMNLLGTLVGGALEYCSMMFGVNALNLIAIALYFFAFCNMKSLVLPWLKPKQV